jgi:hypothetical protein
MSRVICLSMIVRDESSVIVRCLESVKDWITHWAIIDTGSTDNTIELIKETLVGIPGCLDQQKWTDDFSLHRNQSLTLARAVVNDRPNALLLFLDADEVVREERFTEEISSEPADGWYWWVEQGDFRYRKLALVSLDSVIEWHGRRHEWLELMPSTQVKYLKQTTVHFGSESARRQNNPDWPRDDIALLDDCFEDLLMPWRNLYFIARTFEVTGQYESAVRAYRLAAERGDIPVDDCFQCRWGVARSIAMLPDTDVGLLTSAWYLAHEVSPSRVEPLVALAGIARLLNKPQEAFFLAETALNCSDHAPETSMYDHSALQWRAQHEFALCAIGTASLGKCHLARQSVMSALAYTHGGTSARANLTSVLTLVNKQIDQLSNFN